MSVCRDETGIRTRATILLVSFSVRCISAAASYETVSSDGDGRFLDRPLAAEFRSPFFSPDVLVWPLAFFA